MKIPNAGEFSYSVAMSAEVMLHIEQSIIPNICIRLDLLVSSLYPLMQLSVSSHPFVPK